MKQSINTDSKNSKEPQQKYRLGTVSIKILGDGGLTCNSWISCGLTSLSTVFQSYKDNGDVKMKGTV